MFYLANECGFVDPGKVVLENLAHEPRFQNTSRLELCGLDLSDASSRCVITLNNELTPSKEVFEFRHFWSQPFPLPVA